METKTRLTSFEGLSVHELRACIAYCNERQFKLKEQMVLRKLRGKQFYSLKVEYVQLKRLNFLLASDLAWFHRWPAVQSDYEADRRALAAYLASPEYQVKSEQAHKRFVAWRERCPKM
jgi:hypothetical protein